MRLLVSAGSNVNWQNNEGITSVYMAAQNGHNEIVKVWAKMADKLIILQIETSYLSKYAILTYRHKG